MSSMSLDRVAGQQGRRMWRVADQRGGQAAGGETWPSVLHALRQH